jgi:hypothetical protein
MLEEAREIMRREKVDLCDIQQISNLNHEGYLEVRNRFAMTREMQEANRPVRVDPKSDEAKSFIFGLGMMSKRLSGA